MSNADTPAENTGGNTATSTSGPLADLPPRIRVHALAKLLGTSSRELLAKLAELGESSRSAQSSVPRDLALRVAGELGFGDPADSAEPAESVAETAPVAPAPVAETPESPAPAEAPQAPAAQEATQAPRTVRARKAPPHVPVFAAPSPVFLPPEPVEAPKRRRGARTEEDGADLAEQDNADLGDLDEDTRSSADTDDGDDGEDSGGRRRRRRGRRGRGRGKGGEDTGENEGESDRSADEQQPRRGRGRSNQAEGEQDEPNDQGRRSPKSEQGDKQDRPAKQDKGGRAEKPEKSEKTEKTSDSGSEGDSGQDDADGDSDSASKRRRRRRRRKGGDDEASEGSGSGTQDDPPNTVVHVREQKNGESGDSGKSSRDGVRSVRGSTRLEAKRQRRRDGREAGRRRAPILSEAEFLARRESVARSMVVAEKGDSTHIGVLEDGVLVEHFVTSSGSGSIVGNVYLGRVQNVLPSMEAAFIDIGRGRNAVLYAGEVDWDAAGLEGKARKIEQALSSGDSVLVQVTKDPVGHKGARLTTQISLPGRFLVYVPAGGATGISRKLPENERRRLKDILKRVVPEDAGVIIRTASEGVSEAELDRDVQRLKAQWDVIKQKAGNSTDNGGRSKKSGAPVMLYEEPDLLVKVVRDLFTEDFTTLEIQGGVAWETIQSYVQHVAPDLGDRLKRYTGTGDVFADHRIDEQITKALDRKVWLPSGGYLVIDRTEAMTVIDVNTGKFTGSGGNLEETVTRNNLESAEEIVRQLRLRDIGGIIVIDFIDMVLESNRELVLRRLTECLGRDRTRHQVAEVTSLGLVQMTRKRVGTGLLEAFSTTCEHCKGRGVLVSTDLAKAGGGHGNGGHGGGGHSGGGHGGGQNNGGGGNGNSGGSGGRRSRGRNKGEDQSNADNSRTEPAAPAPTPEQRESVASAVQAMANASHASRSARTDEAPDVVGDAESSAPVSAAATGVADGSGTSDRPGTSGSAGTSDSAGTSGASEATEAPAASTAEAEPVTGAISPRTRTADHPERNGHGPQGATEPAADTAAATETSGTAAEPAGSEPEAELAVPASPPRRRPRRAASRPAGPPVGAGEQG